MVAHIYIATDGADPKLRKRQYGYVLECEYHGAPQTKEGFGRMTGTYNQAVLTALSEALERFTRRCEVHIHTDNTYVLGMIANNLSRWALREFRTAAGKPLKNQKEWMRLWEAIRGHSVLGDTETLAYSSWLRAEIDQRKTRET